MARVRVPDAVALSVVSDAVAVVAVCRHLVVAELPSGARSLEAGGVPRERTVVPVPAYLPLKHEECPHLAAEALGSSTGPLSASEEVGISFRPHGRRCET